LISKVGTRVGAKAVPGTRVGPHVRTRLPIRIPTPVKQVGRILPIPSPTRARNLRSMPSSDDDLDLLGRSPSP
jgi:hypothetical protein